MNLRQNILQEDPKSEYSVIGRPITVATKEPTSKRTELRITRTQRADEDAPRVDVRYFTVHSDGRETPHRAGLRLTEREAAALRDALDAMPDL